MVKKRIVPKFLIKEGRLVKGVRFHDNFREAGNPVTTARVYDSYGVDEIIFLDIDASVTGDATVVDIIERVSTDIFMPFTAGGGVRTLEDVNNLLRAGADKVSVNTRAVEKPEFVRDAASRFGDQCMTVSIDYRRAADGGAVVCTNGGHKEHDIDPIDWALRMQDAHCGEILMSSIDRDGTMRGYDLDMIDRASELLEVPLIASSGAGSLEDCLAALETGASAIAVSSLFLFTDHSPIKMRSFLRSKGINVRANQSSRN